MCKAGEVKFSNPYWTTAWKISYLQRRVLVHCIIYYIFDTSVVTDEKYNILANQLECMQNEYKVAFKKSTYYYAFKDFTKSTGFDLYHNLTNDDKEYLEIIASNVIRGSKRHEVK